MECLNSIDGISSSAVKSRLDEIESRLGKMQTTERLTCENCGAPLPANGKCLYCGTQYHVDHESPYYRDKFLRIEVEKPGIHTLRAVARIDRFRYEDAPPEAVANIAMQQIKASMMDNLTAFIKFSKETQPWEDVELIQGTLRVVDPSFKF